MYKIEKSKFIQKVLLCFGWIGCFLLISLGYFLGFDITFFSIIIYIVSLASLFLLCIIIYLILRRYSKIIFSFESKKIEVINNGNIDKTIQVTDIQKIFYVRTFWMLLSQMGASYLMIEYINNNRTVKEYISMSKSDVKKIEKIINLTIEIR